MATTPDGCSTGITTASTFSSTTRTTPTACAVCCRWPLRNALNPDASDFVFFVADGTGGHAFAVTLEEHNINVAKWRAIEAEQVVPEN